MPPGRWASTLIVLSLAGCGTGVSEFDITDFSFDTDRPPAQVSADGSGTGEPDDTFAQASAAVFDTGGLARLTGTISAPGDLDVYLLGPLSRGDQLVVDAATPGSRLDVSVAIFDDGQRLVQNNDDREGTSDRFLDSRIDFVVRHSGGSYYLVVTHSAFAETGTFTGGYNIDVTVIGGGAVPEPVQQTLLLDFDGALVDSETIGVRTLDPFDAADLSPIYRGQTQTIKDAITATFEDNFSRFNVLIVTTDDPLSAGGVDLTEVSTIYFGGRNDRAFGIAEGVDLYNTDFCDDAIIFVETFSPTLFVGTPTAFEMGVAIGNVGSHEAGHLLGLNHVDDDRALMDDQSDTDVFLANQEFIQAPLSLDIMPIGTQDAVLLLDEIVGPVQGRTLRRMIASPLAHPVAAREFGRKRVQLTILKSRAMKRAMASGQGR